MKNLKILITTVITLFFISITFSANAADCSSYKTFSHKWIMCKGGKLKSLGSNNSETTNTSETAKVTTGKKKLSIFQKIRTFGGKKKGPDDE